ncbi:TPA: nucleotide exchange factor GrpE [Candidatus Taylorbacteria bacterium]|nr:nucleotide exchange factor GrpE [Candidatus Taylorbacteria bacterium]
MTDEIKKQNDTDKQADSENDMPIDQTAPADETQSTDDAAKDDVVFEDEDGEGSTLNSAAKIKQLREKLKKSDAERMEYLSGWQRAKADLVNARKRDEEDKKSFVKYANEDLIGEILTVLDSFDMAFANKEAWEKVDKNWRMGVGYIYSQLLSTLDRFNLKVVNPAGQKFDPNHHVSIENVSVTDKTQDGMIVDVVQKGYELNGKVIRAPKVKVGEFVA